MKRVKFICFYDIITSKYKREYILSATTKIDYIISALNRAGYGVDIISCSKAIGGSFAYDRGKSIKLNERNTLTLFSSVSFPIKKITSRIDLPLVYSQFKRWCRKNIKESDTVIVYHSPRYDDFFTELRKQVNFTLIGEIEEIYQDVRTLSSSSNEQEYEFFNACDRYIFPTQLLDEKLNTSHKPSVTIHGLYNVQPDRKVCFNDNKVHVVYAGTLDPQKGGAAAAAAAAYLPENFHIHILGFGNDRFVSNIKSVVAETAKVSKCGLTFHGLLQGEEFIQFIQKCEIGLSTQDPNAAFNATSFPSKILNYMSNGLKVVTIDIPAIRKSAVGENLFYYEKQTPQEIAKAILFAHKSDNYNGRGLLINLDNQFVKDIARLIE